MSTGIYRPEIWLGSGITHYFVSQMPKRWFFHQKTWFSGILTNSKKSGKNRFFTKYISSPFRIKLARYTFAGFFRCFETPKIGFCKKSGWQRLWHLQVTFFILIDPKRVFDVASHSVHQISNKKIRCTTKVDTHTLISVCRRIIRH